VELFFFLSKFDSTNLIS